MNLKIKIILATALLCLGFLKGNAQTNKPEFSPSHLQAAESFLIATGVDKQIGNISDNMLSTLGNQIPEDKKAAFAAISKKFMGKYFSWDIMKAEYSKIYASEFSESDLKELTAFYNTPAGRNYVQKLPALTQKEILFTQKTASVHQAELLQMIQEAMN